MAALEATSGAHPVRPGRRDRHPGDWVGTPASACPPDAAGTRPDRANDGAEATTVPVAYDYTTERPIRVPDPWRVAFATYEGRTGAYGVTDSTAMTSSSGRGMSYVGAIRAAQLG